LEVISRHSPPDTDLLGVATGEPISGLVSCEGLVGWIESRKR